MGYQQVSENDIARPGDRYRLTLMIQLPFNQVTVAMVEGAVKGITGVGELVGVIKVEKVEARPPMMSTTQTKVLPWPLLVQFVRV